MAMVGCVKASYGNVWFGRLVLASYGKSRYGAVSIGRKGKAMLGSVCYVWVGRGALSFGRRVRSCCVKVCRGWTRQARQCQEWFVTSSLVEASSVKLRQSKLWQARYVPVG